jgi:hypothetical protein
MSGQGEAESNEDFDWLTKRAAKGDDTRDA